MRTVVGRMTYRALGETTDHNPETVRRYIQGQAPSADFLTALVSRFELNADWLLTGRGPMKAADLKAAALAEANPDELLSAMAGRLETVCDRVERLEVFMQTMEVLVRHAEPKSKTEGKEANDGNGPDDRDRPDRVGDAITG